MEGEPDLQPAVLLMEQGETVAEIRDNKTDNCDCQEIIHSLQIFWTVIWQYDIMMCHTKTENNRIEYHKEGILHQKISYRLNLIFWIVMGFIGQRGLKTTETWKFWSQNLSSGVLRRGAPGVSRHSAMGFRGAAPLIKDFSDLSFRAVPWGLW